MDYKDMTRQLIDFQRHAFNNTFNMMVLFQDQAQKASDMILEQAAWLPEETKTWMDDCTDAMKKGREG